MRLLNQRGTWCFVGEVRFVVGEVRFFVGEVRFFVGNVRVRQKVIPRPPISAAGRRQLAEALDFVVGEVRIRQNGATKILIRKSAGARQFRWWPFRWPLEHQSDNGYAESARPVRW